MKRKREITPVCKSKALNGTACGHRLHYHWSNLETDRARANSLGSPSNPRRKVDRFLRPSQGQTCGKQQLGKSLRRQARFNLCANVYQTIEYNTFSKNGVLKLTEVELYFLSLHMTKRSSHEWALVYLGVGNGERFRHLRDEFFPELSVIAFDPLDVFFSSFRDDIERAAQVWSNDGSNFTFLVRCFDADEDIDWIKEKFCGKKLLLISDIRGINLSEDGRRFDTLYDQEIQWKAIQRLRPERSLVKFNNPDGITEIDYPPGVLLKQIFCYFGTTELRLIIDGVPEHTIQYKMDDLHEQVTIHHERLRGQVYSPMRRSHRSKFACLDCCFDCTVLWNTVSLYARQNSIQDPDEVLDCILRNSHYDNRESTSPWLDVGFYLQNGRLMEAMSALDASGFDDHEPLDLDSVLHGLSAEQPDLAQRLAESLPSSACCADMVQLLGSLSNPFTLVRTELNGLLIYPDWAWTRPVDLARRKAAIERNGGTGLDMTYYKKSLCWYYVHNQHCQKGWSCTYKHGDDDVGVVTAEPAVDNQLCWRFQQGCCVFGAKCWWSHDVANTIEGIN